MASYKRVPSTDDLLYLARRVHREAKELGITSALAGGLAMNLYGSPRLTKDVDFISEDLLNEPVQGLIPVREISFGGNVYTTNEGIPIDWIVRVDHYRFLYAEALQEAREESGMIPVVSIEHLAAIKLAASVKNPKHYEDLLFLLAHPDVDLQVVKNLVFKHLGGAFAVEQLEASIDEAVWRREKSE